MTGHELRQKYLAFFKKAPRHHRIIPSSPLVPENDPSTLFTSAGMQPLIPYLLGAKHPLGSRLANSQTCFRAQDIEEVGDNRHTTFFEMLGNWSLGDYFKEEQLPWLFSFLTQEIGLNQSQLYVSVFSGHREIPIDSQSIAIWQKLFKTPKGAFPGEKGFSPEVKIYRYSAEKNWWSRSGPPDKMPPGEPGGPTSEIFYDFGPDLKIHENSKFASFPCHPNCDCGRFLEIGNSVFMAYQKNKQGSLSPLSQKNIDFGGGLERILAAHQNNPDIFETDLFLPILAVLEKESGQRYAAKQFSMRVIADHFKAAVFMAQQGLTPGNKQQGYLMRRLIRRAVVKLKQLNIDPLRVVGPLYQQVFAIYADSYFSSSKPHGLPIVEKEVRDFLKTLTKGTRLLESQSPSGQLLFDLYQSYGMPFEVAREILVEQGRDLSPAEVAIFQEAKLGHQAKSRSAGKGLFKGGLADSSLAIVRLHTATHLLHAALRQVLGAEVSQAGSNITRERARFDFTFPKPLSDSEIEKIETLINEQIKANLPVREETLPKDQALASGALAFFPEKYPPLVKTYRIGHFSYELCGGPHLASTGEIEGRVKIEKQASIGAGKRRVYLVIKPF